MTYNDYLKSEDWKQKKLDKLKHTKKRCGICGKNKNIHLHHLIYKDLISVKRHDLRWLCAKCHKTAHELIKVGILIYKSESHHSRFATTKNRVKKALGYSNKNMFTDL